MSADHEQTAIVLPAPLLDDERLGELRECFSAPELNMLLESIADEGGAYLRAVQDALVAQDFEAAQRAAHTLKGLANNLGASRLAAAALDVELAAVARRNPQSDVLALADAFTATEQRIREIA